MNKKFLKMHGLGNDFVIIDGRLDDFVPNVSFLLAVADRKRGVGCDQIIILRKPRDPAAQIYVDMYNSDGSKLRACGNVTRCVAQLLFEELGRTSCVIQTVSGLLACYREASGLIAVDFGPPRLTWQEIPLANESDTLNVNLEGGRLKNPCCVNMGNPHAVFFVPDVTVIPLIELGPKLENDSLFPDRCNIEVAQILAPDRIRMRVWERGAGLTEACGSGACATLVAAVRRNLSARRATIHMDGGEVLVEWREDGHVLLIGPAALSFSGTLHDDLFTQARQAP